jgi:Domain of unknown function (DUF929)
MGNADPRNQSARERIAAQQMAAARAEARRRFLIVGGSVVAVLAIVVGLIVYKSVSNPAAPIRNNPVSASVITTVTHDIATVPASALNAAGNGPAYPATGSLYPHAVQTIRTAARPLTSAGKPQIVYVGAEYCPFCAAERWALTVALSRFGTFSGLRLIHSSGSDTDPNTPTLSFAKATYTSKYLVFTPTEVATVAEAPLQPMTSLDKAVMTRYDAPPYVPKGYNGAFPFVDFGNKYVIDGASYDAGLLANLTWQQIGADLANPSSTVGRAIDAAANHITAAICKITNNQPGNVCTSTGVTAASGSI